MRMQLRVRHSSASAGARAPTVLAALLAAALAPAGAARAVAGPGLTLAWEAEVRTIDPRYAVDANSQYLEHLLNCSLVKSDKDGQTVADLAKEWKWLSPTSLELTLNPAKFSDGTPVTAADVKATYDSFKKEGPAASPRKGAFVHVKTITAKGDDKVVFDLDEADSTFVANNLVVGILPAKLAAKDAMLTDADAAQLAGCGPFKLKSFATFGLELEANPSYSLGAAPKTPTVTIKIVKDETTRYAKLQAGEVDIVQNAIGRDKVTDLAKKNPALRVVKRPGLNTTYLGFNMRDPIVGKAEVRQALAHAIDRDKIIKFVLNGLAIPATTLLTPSDPFYSKAVAAPAVDLAQAKALLDKAGFPDPDGDGPKPRFKLTYKTTTDLTRVQIAKAIAADLRKIGVDVSVESLEWGKFKSDVEAGKVQMWSLAWVGFKDPDIYRFAFGSDSFPPNGGNRGWYSNPALDKLLTAAKAETDPKKRFTAYEEVQKIVAAEMPYVFLWHEEIFAVVNEKVADFELYADGQYGALQQAYKK
jgi:peptide/nickel transport system substrate-binding protein